MKRGSGAWKSEENMELTKMTENVENIRNLDTKPNAVNGLSAEELKAAFDKGAVSIKEYLNDTLIPELDEAFGSSVPETRKVNGKPLNEDITLTAEDVAAVPKTRKVNEQSLDSDITVSAADIPYTPSDDAPFYGGKNTVEAVLDALTVGDAKLYFTDADISAVAGTVKDLDGCIVYPHADFNGGLMPRNGECVVGKNGYLAYADTSIDSDYVAVVSTGEKLFSFNESSASGGYVDKTEDYDSQSEYTDVGTYLRSRGEGQFKVDKRTSTGGGRLTMADSFNCGSNNYSILKSLGASSSKNAWNFSVYVNNALLFYMECAAAANGENTQKTTVLSNISVQTPVHDDNPTTKTYVDSAVAAERALSPTSFPGAGSHNAIYRGKHLGAAVTAAQWAAIAAGTFDDLYIGDYWTIGGVNYRIAAFDYYYNTGDTACTTHHVVIVPDTALYTTAYNDDNVVTDGYVGSKLYTQGLASAKSTIGSAFGSTHILSHRQYLTNAADNGFASGGGWYNSTVELMTEQNVYGSRVFGSARHEAFPADNHSLDNTQFPLFAHRHDRTFAYQQEYWLRDIVSEYYFSAVGSRGEASYSAASNSSGVRPAFCIKG